MKKIIIYMLIFSILTYSAIAATVYEAKSFAEHPEQIVILEERDVVRLNWDNKEHKLMVGKLYIDKNKVDITAFIEGSEVPYYTTITSRSSLELDFDQDLEYDLKISLFNILKDERVVALKLEKIEKEQHQIIIIKEEQEKKFYQDILSNKFYIFAVFFILCFVIWKRRTLLKTYKTITKK